MNNYRILDWDSCFFGLKVAQIICPTLLRDELERTIHSLKKQGVKLVYWPSDPYDAESQRSAQLCSGLLADRKITYVADLCESGLPTCDRTAIIYQYTGDSTNAQLENLAVQAGAYSRFRMDPKIPEDKFCELYKIWIRKSVERDIAEAVFVAYDNENIVGMVTVGVKNSRGDIGLISVDEKMRGRNLGTSLVATAQSWAVSRGFSLAQVVTQGDNTTACRLYEKLGYKIDKIENYYHFWI